MNQTMYEGAAEFFGWLDSEDAYCEITYMPACREVEIKMSILGEGDFYQKRAISFASFMEYAQKHYEAKRQARRVGKPE